MIAAMDAGSQCTICCAESCTRLAGASEDEMCCGGLHYVLVQACLGASRPRRGMRGLTAGHAVMSGRRQIDSACAWAVPKGVAAGRQAHDSEGVAWWKVGMPLHSNPRRCDREDSIGLVRRSPSDSPQRQRELGLAELTGRQPDSATGQLAPRARAPWESQPTAWAPGSPSRVGSPATAAACPRSTRRRRRRRRRPPRPRPLQGDHTSVGPCSGLSTQLLAEPGQSPTQAQLRR